MFAPKSIDVLTLLNFNERMNENNYYLCEKTWKSLDLEEVSVGTTQELLVKNKMNIDYEKLS